MTARKQTKKPAAVPKIEVSHCTITAEASKTTADAAAALAELARASTEHARAITTIAEALKSAPGRIDTGILISADPERN